MINSENSSIDELLTIDTIKNNILPKYSIYNADINTVKIKDTTKQRAVFKINYNISKTIVVVIKVQPRISPVVFKLFS